MLHIATFAEIEHEFIARVHTAVWCNGATVDRQQRPRSRVLHPIWEGATGWVTTGRRSTKVKQLAANPYMSLAYIADPSKPVYVECYAVWNDQMADKQRIWQRFATTPEPLGFNPAPTWGSIDNSEWGLLQLTPWRIELYDLLDQRNRSIWQP